MIYFDAAYIAKCYLRVTQCNVHKLPAERQAGGKNGRHSVEGERRLEPSTSNLYRDDRVVLEKDSDERSA